ncbi:MAG: hypothetical protein B6I31_00680 [Desulfobacteraceae bacterium 4572_19]|nr:MAG: hypothetical protein B6I31_00680 [Desulfobacteraceae bacterium 4572_19]
MEKIAIVGCGAYMDSGYGCPGMSIKLSQIKPDAIYLSSCLVNAKPGCPYSNADQMAEIIEKKTGIKVIQL